VLRSIPLDRQVTNEVEMGMSVAADGKTAVIAATDVGKGGGASHLFLVDLVTGKTESLSSSPDISEDMPVFASSDTVIFVGGIPNADAPDGWVGLLTLGSKAVRRLTPKGQVARSADVVFGAHSVIYDAFPISDRSALGLWTVDLSGGEPASVLKHADAGYPSWYKNGQWVLITEAGNPSTHGDLHLLPVK
jgi:Tol biopolymer transport system component